MKRSIIAIFLAAIMLTAFAACGGNPAENETFTATLVPRTVTVLVTLPDGTQDSHEITTTEQMLGMALDESGLIERDEKGMIVKVAGVEASWANDQAYWGFYIDGDFAMHGVDDEILADGNEYELRYTKS